MGGELLEVKELDDADAAKDEKASQKEKRLKLRLLRTKMMAVKQGADDSIVAGYEPKGEMVEGAVATIKKVAKAGVKRHKKAVENKKIKDRKAVPYAALAAEHQPEGEVIDELNRYEKETGKSSGSLNMPKGRPTKKGGDPSPVMRSVRTMMRSQEGKPEGQRKKVKGKKPPKAGEYGARRSPEEIVKKRRWDKKRADDAMRDTSGT